MESRRPVAPNYLSQRSPKTLTPGVQLVEASAVVGVHSSYIWQNIAVTLWFGPATMESLVVYEQGCKRFCAKYPQGVSSVHFMVPGGRSMPTSEARAELARIIHDYAHRVAAAAVVIPGGGFWASALRGLVTALAVLSPSAMGIRIFSDLAPLADWLLPLHNERTGVEVDPAELLGMLREVERVATAAAA